MEHYLIKKTLLMKGLSEFLKDSKIMSLSEFIKGKLDNKVYVRSYFRRRPVKK